MSGPNLPLPGPSLVVGDTHGNDAALRGLLRQEGLLDGANQRLRPDVNLIHVGDLANCVAESERGDVACLKLASRVFDVILVGNHEYPYVGANSYGRFAGFFAHASVSKLLLSLESAGKLQPCMLLGGILVTHAGATTHMAAPEDDYAGWATAAEAADDITYAWQYLNRGTTGMFCAVGWARGGRTKTGGILWADYGEPKAPFSQIFGHTPGDEIRIDRRPDGTFTACIDLGCGKRVGTQGAVWVEDGELCPVASKPETPSRA